LFATPFVAGWLIATSREWKLLGNDALAAVVGTVLIGTGVAVAAAGVWQFRRAGTTVLPFGGTSRIVEAGVYKWTRNPMYLGMALAYAGGAFLINSVWPLPFLPVAIVLVQVGVIRREERYLSSKFGDAYEQYRLRVRPWL
jgi:protein-S-isoprenylcysteine O-methyltransferase Ste14